MIVWHRLNIVQPCSVHPAILPKPELTLDLTEETLKIYPWKLFFSKNMSLVFILCDFIKNELHHRDYLAWVLQGTFFTILENFLRGITAISFIQEFITLLSPILLWKMENNCEAFLPSENFPCPVKILIAHLCIVCISRTYPI